MTDPYEDETRYPMPRGWPLVLTRKQAFLCVGFRRGGHCPSVAPPPTSLEIIQGAVASFARGAIPAFCAVDAAGTRSYQPDHVLLDMIVGAAFEVAGMAERQGYGRRDMMVLIQPSGRYVLGEDRLLNPADLVGG